jgi:hypothetical protein
MVILLDSLLDLRILHSDVSTIRLVPDLPEYARECLLLASSMNLSFRERSTKHDPLLLSKKAVHTPYCYEYQRKQYTLHIAVKESSTHSIFQGSQILFTPSVPP